MGIKATVRAGAIMVALVGSLAGITAVPAQAAECCLKTYYSGPYVTQSECEAARARHDASTSEPVAASCFQKLSGWWYSYRTATP